MDAERWDRVRSLFDRAIALPAAEREGLLDRECVGDPELRSRLERMLAADEAPPGVLERMDGGAAIRDLPDPLTGTRLGPYRLIERHGAGGMGVVYRAERVDGTFEREVAIKVLRADVIDEAAVHRFEHERRTLASLDHPDIAGLLDAGSTPDGRPYLVMEFVRGAPIDAWCAGRGCTIEQRLRLLITVARAIQAAHDALVVHRDLKPGNVLIDESGQPKVVDFGISRVLEVRHGTSAPATRQAPLTPEYASPEQLAGAPTTTRIDVYALGVLAYELLTGVRPPPPTVAEPTIRPSRAVEAKDRRLGRRLRGDLDRIVLMAMRPEPDRRFPSAIAFANDLENHLRGLPVTARADSWSYVAGRLLRRHWLPSAAAMLALGGLAFGYLAARSGERVATAEAQHARAESETSQELSKLLMDATLESVDPDDAAALARIESRLLELAETARRKYAGRNHEVGNLLDGLGVAATRLGAYDVARDLLSEGLSVREGEFGTDGIETSRSLQSIGRLHYVLGEYGAGKSVLARGLAIQRSHPTTTHSNIPSFMNDLASCLRALGELDEAQSLHEEALALREAEDPDSLSVAESANNLAAVHAARGSLREAVRLLDRSHGIRSRVLGDDAAATIQSVNNLAVMHWKLGDRQRAIERLEAAERGYRGLQSAGRPALAQLLLDLAAAYEATDDPGAAVAKLREAVTLHEECFGETHPRTESARQRLRALD